MALIRSRVIAVGLMLVAAGCGADESAATQIDTTAPSASVGTTVVETMQTVPPTNAASTTSVLMTTTSVAATNVATTIAMTGPLDTASVAEALGRARVRWSEAGIANYRLTVAEDRNYWSQGCRWITVVSDDVVTASEVDPSSTSSECQPFEWTVEQLHEMIAGWLDAVDEFASPEFGEHTLSVRFSDIGVPVAMEFDLANGNDEESSMSVALTLDS